MLETDIRDLFDRLAAEQPPPPHISMPAARRTARRRLAWRRTGTLGAPLLAVAAVISVAVASAIPGGGLGVGQGPVASPVAPKYFNPLRPFASIRWLPAGFGPLEATTSRVGIGYVSVGRAGSVSFSASSSGRCRLDGHDLRCGTAPGVTPALFPLGSQAGVVDGHPAYLVTLHVGATPSPEQSPLTLRSPEPTTSPQPSGSSVQSAAARAVSGTLTWQYARGGWAMLYVMAPGNAFLRTVLRIARSIRFGPAVASYIRFPYQLTRAPADWHVTSVQAVSQHDVLSAQFYDVTAGQSDDQWVSPPPRNVVAIVGDETPTACGHSAGSRTVRINGYAVVLTPPRPMWMVPQLCGGDIDGVGLTIYTASRPAISAASLFAHHFRILGPDPANWTTVPIR
jgi:hypothetical protein